MKITYDEESDALMIILADAEVSETRNIAPGVEVDYDCDGRVLSLEVLNAGRKYDIEGLDAEDPDLYFSLAEAGAMCGISPTTLRHQIERGVLKGVKFGRNWMVHWDDLNSYRKERSRKANAKVRPKS